MNDLPDYLPGNPPMYGVKQEASQYYQGVDINIDATLAECNQPVDQDLYVLKAVIKTALDDNRPVWIGYLNSGIFVQNGLVKIRVPHNITCKMPSGVYYIAIVGTLKTDPGHSAVLFVKTLSVNQAATSPLPVIVGAAPVIPSFTLDGVILPINYNF